MPVIKQKENKSILHIAEAVKAIGGKWKPVIIQVIGSDKKRFGILKNEVPGITQKVLSQQLRELELSGLVKKKVFAEVPPKVEYSLTKSGTALSPVLTSLTKWSKDHLKKSSR